MSRVLQNFELNYTTMENQAYALVKSLKHFRNYVGYSKIIVFVPHSVVKDILTQTDCLGTRARWITKIQEYDLEIRPTKIVKGQGFAKMMTKGNETALGLICLNDSSSLALQRLGEHEIFHYVDENLKLVPQIIYDTTSSGISSNSSIGIVLSFIVCNVSFKFSST